MTIATDMSGAYFWVYLNTAEVVGASSYMAREATVAEDDLARSYTDVLSWDAVASDVRITCRTAVSEKAPIVFSEKHADGDVIDEVVNYGNLLEGWDGERAAKPDAESIYDAVRFVRAASGLELEIVPTLHVDGSIILEVNNEGSVRFLGRGKTVYAFDGSGYGKAEFDGFAIPAEIKHALHI